MKAQYIALRALVLLLLLLVLAVVAGQAAEDHTQCPPRVNEWTANLTPEEEVPPVPFQSNAVGAAIFKLEEEHNRTTNAKQLVLQFYLWGIIENATAAHIHLGPRCVAGPIVVFLFSAPQGSPVTTTGLLSMGKLTDADLIGPLANRTIADLVREIDDGNAYVNVHTVLSPTGEMRGQIRSEGKTHIPNDDDDDDHDDCNGNDDRDDYPNDNDHDDDDGDEYPNHCDEGDCNDY